MESYLSKYKADWDDLESLIRKAQKCFRRMSAEELSRLDVLYRRASVHLVRVSSRTTDHQLIEYLNSLTGQAHAIIYLPPARFLPQRVYRFLAREFARTVAQTWRFHAAAAMLMVGGFAIAWLAATINPGAAYAIMPAGEFRLPGATREQLLEALRYGRDEQHGEKFLFASFLFSHNLKVGLLAMATGVLAAIPTILLTVYNGMMLGVFTATHQQAGIFAEYWAWILPHGITELSAVTLCGGIGLLLGHGMVCPGRLSRQASMQIAGGHALKIAGGAAVMLVFAAIIESYLRQSHLGTPARLSFAAATAVFWTLYFWSGFWTPRKVSDERIAAADAATPAGSH